MAKIVGENAAIGTITGGVAEATVGMAAIAPSSTSIPPLPANVCWRRPPTISQRFPDGRPRSTVPSLGAARRRPPPSELIVL